MKLTSLFATSAILLTSVLHAQEPIKEVIEVNVSYNLKFHLQQPQIVQGNTTIYSAKVFSIKTADIIRLIGQKEGKSFSQKARLLYSYERFNNDDQLITYIIRDAGTDHLVTTYIDTFTPLFSEQPYLITKGKVHVTTNIGKASQLATHKHNIALTGNVNIPTQGFELVGPGTISYKMVNSTKLTEQVPLIVPVASFVLSGRGIDVDGNSGYVAGTVKLTGPKVLK